MKEIEDKLQKSQKQHKEYEKSQEKVMKSYAELQKNEKKFDEKINELYLQKNQAVKQWQQIVVEMEKQKDIISSLQK